MAKNRELSSIEHGLAEAIRNLKTEVIEEVTGKSESYIRKCSDPDLEQQLDHRDAVKIDKACIENGLAPYLLNSHNYIIMKELAKANLGNQSINELLVQFTISMGKLLDTIKTAKSSKGEKGGVISAAEKKEIYEALHELEDKIVKVKTSVEKS
jgi:hypothetical protein